jgi:hypothetical protein
MKNLDFSTIKDLTNPKTKTIKVHHGFEPTRGNLASLIRLSEAFNKTVTFKIFKNLVRIDGDSKVTDVFNRCRELEAKRIAYKPSRKTMEKSLKAIRDIGDDGPYAGFMSG